MARETHTQWYTGDERPANNKYGARMVFGWDIVNELGRIVASCDADAGDPNANAALIVAAVNERAALRDALRVALHGLDTDGQASACAALNTLGRAALAPGGEKPHDDDRA